MRRNLRLDWRALALLGALLSIIIEWPGLVFAMPTIKATTPATIDTINATTTSTTIAFNQTSGSIEPPIDLINIDNYRNITAKRASFSLSDSLSVNLKQATHMSVQQTNLSDIFYNNAKKQPQRTFANNSTNTTKTAINYDNNNVNNFNQNTSHPNNIKATTISSSSTQHIPTSQTTPISSSDTNENAHKELIQNTIKSPENNEEEQQKKDYEVVDDLSASFQLSSANHIAILSRTERSIRSEHNELLALGNNGSGNADNIVSRFSDATRTSHLNGSKTKRLNNSRNLNHNHSHSHNSYQISHAKSLLQQQNSSSLDRIERAVPDLSGISRKIQIYIKNSYLEILPDGTVGGTQNFNSDYTILYRVTINVGLIKIQSVATCLYLCMDECGSVYASKEFNDDCVFNETMGQHKYNIYTSTYNSNDRHILYLALNGQGKPRKLHINRSRTLGKLAQYANALTETVDLERVELLIARNYGANRVKHGIRQLCDIGKPLIELIDSKNFKAPPKCNLSSSSSSSSNSNNSSSKKLGKSSSSNSSSNSSSLSSNSGSIKNSSSKNSGRLSGTSVSSSVNSSSDVQSSISDSQNSSSSSTNGSSVAVTNKNINSSSGSAAINSNNSEIQNNNQNQQQQSNSTSGHNKRGKLSHNSNSNHSGGDNVGRGPKRRKCRPNENEHEHNCRMAKPAALRKPNQKLKRQKQKQQGQNATILAAPSPKNGLQKIKPNKPLGGNAKKKNALNNRRGKRLNANVRQVPKNGKMGGKKKGAGQQWQNGTKRAQQRLRKTSTTSTTTTTLATTLRTTATLASSTQPTTLQSSTLPSALAAALDSATNDRAEREQRNVHFTNSMENSQEEEGSIENDNDENLDADDEREDTEAPTADEAENTAAEDENDDDAEDSIERDIEEREESVTPTSRTAAATPPPQPRHSLAAQPPNPRITAGADDSSYYDQYDFILLPLGPWKIIALLWIFSWCLSCC